MSGKSKKGGSFEREFCKRLSCWWCGGDDDSLFWRTANSGGRATVRARQNKKTRGHCGDVGATCPEAEPLMQLFAIELKRGYNREGTLIECLDKSPKAKEQTYEKWIAQADAARQRAGALYWIRVTRRDKHREAIYMPMGLGDALKERTDIGAGGEYPQMTLYVPRRGARNGFWVFGMTLDEFFLRVEPKHILDILAETPREKSA